MLKFSPRLAAALLGGASALTIACAAHAQSGPATELPPIDAEAVPAVTADSPTVISGETLRQRRTGLSDTLSMIAGEPGAAVYTGGGISSLPVLRGLADMRVAVTIDGEEITIFCPNEMNPPGSYILPGRVASITLNPTLSPVSAGGDNIAGVIAITSKPPRFAAQGQGLTFSGEVGARYRSVADSPGANLSLTAAGQSFSLGYDAAWEKASNYKSGSGARVRSTLFEAYDQALTLAYKADTGILSLKLGKHFVPYQGFPTQRMDMTENNSNFAELRYRGDYAWGQVEAATSWREVDHEMNFLADKGGSATGGMPMNTQGRDLTATLSAHLPLKAGSTMALGAEVRRTDLDDWWPAVTGSMMMSPLTYWNIRDGRRDRAGVWAEWDGELSRTLSGHFGARYEKVTTDAGLVQPYSWTGMMNAADASAALAFNARPHKRVDDAVDITAKVDWTLSDTTTLELGYARKTRAPGLYERYAWGLGAMSSAMTSFHGDANSYVGDPNLKPEIAHHLAATLAYAQADGRRSFKVAIYRSDVQDYIDATKLADLANGFVRLKFANVDAELYGADAQAQAELWNSAAYGRGRLTATLSWVHGERKDNGDGLYQIPPVTGRVALDQAVGAWTNHVEIELVGEKSKVSTLRHEPKTDAYALLNLGASRMIGKTRVDLGVRNLFDTAYDLPLGGVDYADFRATGSKAPILATPGRGRSFDIGLTYAF